MMISSDTHVNSTYLLHKLDQFLSNYHCFDMSYSYFLIRCNHCYRSMSLCYQYQQDEIHYSLWNHWWVMMDRSMAVLKVIVESN